MTEMIIPNLSQTVDKNVFIEICTNNNFSQKQVNNFAYILNTKIAPYLSHEHGPTFCSLYGNYVDLFSDDSKSKLSDLNLKRIFLILNSINRFDNDSDKRNMYYIFSYIFKGSRNLEQDFQILFSTSGFLRLMIKAPVPVLNENTNIRDFVDEVYKFFPANSICSKHLEDKCDMNCTSYRKGLSFCPEYIKDLWRLWTPLFGYNVITNKIVDTIKKFVNNDKILSIMAGNGLLEYILSKNNMNVTITENGDWEIKPYSNCIPILNRDYSDAIKEFKTNVLLVSWIPYDEEVCDIFDLFKGDKMIIFGEERGGCCANDEFFDKLDENFDSEYIRMDNLPSIHNCLLLCTRKKAKNSWIAEPNKIIKLHTKEIKLPSSKEDNKSINNEKEIKNSVDNKNSEDEWKIVQRKRK